MSDLQRALEMVEAATGPDMDLAVAICRSFLDEKDRPAISGLIVEAVGEGSLGAAVSLIERGMPGWRKQVFERIDDGVISWNARIISPRYDCFATDEDTEKPRTAALALMRVYLRARIAQSEQPVTALSRR